MHWIPIDLVESRRYCADFLHLPKPPCIRSPHEERQALLSVVVSLSLSLTLSLSLSLSLSISIYILLYLSLHPLPEPQDAKFHVSLVHMKNACSSTKRPSLVSLSLSLLYLSPQTPGSMYPQSIWRKAGRSTLRPSPSSWTCSWFQSTLRSRLQRSWPWKNPHRI